MDIKKWWEFKNNDQYMFFRTYAEKLKSQGKKEVKHHLAIKLGENSKNFKLNF